MLFEIYLLTKILLKKKKTGMVNVEKDVLMFDVIIYKLKYFKILIHFYLINNIIINDICS